MKHRFVIFNPGHFHAALVLRTGSARIDDTVNVYAPTGPDLDAFIALVDAFNTRADQPTRWRINIHSTDLNSLIQDKRGSIVVLAGINNAKLRTIAELARSGYHVLGDKPWLTESGQLAHLDAALTAGPVVMDIMTIRHEILSRLCHEVINTPQVFGAFSASSPQNPAVELGSIHHLYKHVNGLPLRRPAWYYDASRQGDGVVDIQSHLVEQALWFIVDDAAIEARDLNLMSAKRWTTPVPLELFQQSTGDNDYPDGVASDIDSQGVLQYPCNGEINWALNGVHVRQWAEWRPVEPKGGGDLHHVLLRGTEATVTVQQGEHTNFAAEVHLAPSAGANQSQFRDKVDASLNAWRQRFPGLSIIDTENGLRLDAPAALDQGHESHFPLVRDEFLDYVESGRLPEGRASRIAARYTLISSARERALRGEKN